MKPVLTPQESERLDEASQDSVDVLMDRAGYAVAVAAAEMGAGYGKRITVLAGGGNNGGDGYVAARRLRRRGVLVDAIAFSSPRAGSPAERALLAARAAGVPITTDTSLPAADRRPDLVVDAVFGAGFHGELPGAVAVWAGLDTPVLSVDVPSGLDAATGEVGGAVFRARRTVTFHALKTGHVLGAGPDVCGQVTVADIGLSGGEPAMRLCDEGDAPRPGRSRTAHKWSAGSVVVVGGSPGLTGAALLTATAALHFGAGAVTIFCPEGLQGIYAAQTPAVMTRGVGSGGHFSPKDVDEVLAAGKRFDVMVLGPGMGLDMTGFVHGIAAGREGLLLIDADGLNGLGGPGPLLERPGPTVLTPHHAELSRVTGEPASLASAHDLARRTGVTVLLKGSPTVVAADDGAPWLVTSGGPELATIGTGDVLGGMIAALWARGVDGATAARSGAYWHGKAAADLSRRGAVTAADLAVAAGRFAFAGAGRG